MSPIAPGSVRPYDPSTARVRVKARLFPAVTPCGAGERELDVPGTDRSLSPGFPK